MFINTVWFSGNTLARSTPRSVGAWMGDFLYRHIFSRGGVHPPGSTPMTPRPVSAWMGDRLWRVNTSAQDQATRSNQPEPALCGKLGE